ncbi:putative S-adenosylmethionine-dependent methyltransferase/MSMEI_2290 [Rosistilla ulvae]|uniref:Putative S-adenosylmethionine-dependent methyltransferase/MSMEI_2290 n=1 Tax=Rosistilla ulvae TaxID=1930277 RepID=A0A517M837_9BACT|nr:class I SAM-dependent methyltransferase [Rosistilla ulvae]QDS91040.1 putative S-adenosylmethionine-dependent methyltransferase/MSMEI_2290 [Rosistilla ulvae]
MTTSDATDYCLPDDYHSQPIPPMVSENIRAEQYWTPKRIRLSSRYQYDVYRVAREIADSNEGRPTIYDIGCGPATKLMRFFGAEFNVIGFDRPEAISYCRRTYRRGTFVEVDLDNTCRLHAPDIPPADIVICADVIEHLQRPERLIATMIALAGNSGTIIISTPERDRLRGPSNRKPTNPEHIREWNATEFSQFLNRCGLEVVQHSIQPQLLPGASFIAWRWIFGQWLAGRSHHTNQVAVCRTKRQVTPSDAGTTK